MDQFSLFATESPKLPEGFRYREDLITRDEEQALVAEFQHLPFKEFEFHGYLGKRRVVSFGWLGARIARRTAALRLSDERSVARGVGA